MHISVKRGLDIPIEGVPTGEVRDGPKAHRLALDLSPFETIKFKVLVQVGDQVKVGQPLLYDKRCPDRKFVSPAGGKVRELRRGLKRRLLSVVIEVADQEEHQEVVATGLVERLLEAGFFAHIRSRPFNQPADPSHLPKAIFVKALESAPFVPPAEMQVAGHEKEFQEGLNALCELSGGPVHLVARPDSPFSKFTGVEHHTVSGPHPAANPSVHIHHIAPITSVEDVIWTVNAHDVVSIGTFLLTGRHHLKRVISVAGGAVDNPHYLRVRNGMPVIDLVSNGNGVRVISGDPLTGMKVDEDDFIAFDHFALTLLPEPKARQLLHFLRLGFGRFSFWRAYLSGHIKWRHPYKFTTSLHGEERAFIDATVYGKVMPMKIPTVQLVKAIIAEDWDKAEELGIYEVDSEDFALPTFVCPSKVEMVSIVKEGIQKYSQEVMA